MINNYDRTYYIIDNLSFALYKKKMNTINYEFVNYKIV